MIGSGARRVRTLIAGGVGAVLTVACVTGGASALDMHDADARLDASIASAQAWHGQLARQAMKSHDAGRYTKDQVLEQDAQLVSSMDGVEQATREQLSMNVLRPDTTGYTADAKRALAEKLDEQSDANRRDVEQLKDLTPKLEKSKAERDILNAREAVKAALDKGDALLKSSDGNVDDNKTREDLRNAINAANGYEEDRDVNGLNAKAKTITDKLQPVNDAVKARQDRIAREQAEAAARAAAQATAARQTSGSGSYSGSSYGSGYGGGSYGSGARSYTGTGSGYSARRSNGYTVGGNCYSVGQCQGAIDSSGTDVMQAYHTAGGSTYYGIHNGNGGAAMWGQSSATINGQQHSLGAWQQAQYIDGKPYGVDDGGSYVQTCGPDGKVYYAKVN
ncbi:colicin transporter [Bifidobacterium sp. DSM 109959]|uniref:Colicin transporter n=2 Tax=Bifidobacterium olomucense TaxID=2675324 RepID=A0A7Y0HVT2_9BIFI|nr:colicin transporter [Bifidobacterium sp. DSM 109959]